MLIKRVTVIAAASTLALAGCASPSTDDDGRPHVLAALYPLQFVAAEVAGGLATVESVTPQGAEPHDLELAPAQVRAIGDADLLVYISGFQAALDDAVAQRSPGAVIDATAALGLADDDDAHDDDEHGDDAHGDHAHGDEHGDEHGDDEHDHDEHDQGGPDDDGHGAEAHHDDDGHDDEHAHDDAHDDDAAAHDHSGHDHDGDPHFWLDPTLLAALAGPVADALSEIDPDNAETYAANAQRLTDELTALDTELAAGLASCERDVVVVSHEAFGYLTERYGLTQLGLSGIDPEGEPSPARLREIRAAIAEHDVTTVFTETLVSPKAAEVLASDLGLATAQLDPVEAQVDPDADYRDVMRANLAALRLALGCA